MEAKRKGEREKKRYYIYMYLYPHIIIGDIWDC